MKKKTRDITAVVLIFFLLISGAIIMAYFIFMGHNWNYAASHIDESIGRMDGYAVVLYKGTQEQDNLLDNAEVYKKLNPYIKNNDNRFEVNDVALNIKKAEQLYQSKGATTFVVDTRSIDSYKIPFTVIKNGISIGFLSAFSNETRSSIRSDVKMLEGLHPHYIVALTNDGLLSYSAVDGLIGPVSIVINTSKQVYVSNEHPTPIFQVRSPYKNTIGAVIISPSGVCSTKILKGDEI